MYLSAHSHVRPLCFLANRSIQGLMFYHHRQSKPWTMGKKRRLTTKKQQQPMDPRSSLGIGAQSICVEYAGPSTHKNTWFPKLPTFPLMFPGTSMEKLVAWEIMYFCVCLDLHIPRISIGPQCPMMIADPWVVAVFLLSAAFFCPWFMVLIACGDRTSGLGWIGWRENREVAHGNELTDTSRCTDSTSRKVQSQWWTVSANHVESKSL